MNSYELSRNWFNYCFDNPEKVKPIHSALYFFAIEHCNRLGWKDKFGFPSQMVMEALGIKNWRTYSKALNELVDFGFIQMIEISKNQYSSNIIAIVKNTKAHTKALDKALQKHGTKHSQSTVSIDKQYNKEQYNKGNDIYNENDFLHNWNLCRTHYLKKPSNINKLSSWDRTNFKTALINFSKEEINTAMHGLFKQKNLTIGAMTLQPKHFLENIDKYYNAESGKEYGLYGQGKVKTEL